MVATIERPPPAAVEPRPEPDRRPLPPQEEVTAFEPAIPAPATTTDAIIDRLLVARATEPPHRAGTRKRAVAALAAIAGHRREPLDRARAHFQKRLSRRSDDYEATRGLQMVEAALVHIAHP
jgi:hypothetical protein